MKRCMKLIPKLLEIVEQKTTGEPSYLPDIRGYEAEAIHYHVQLCVQAGYLDAQVISGAEDPSDRFAVGTLTWQGHEALAKMRKYD